jgi:SAM-dependent methyltransferase
LATRLSQEQLRTLSRQGAANRVAELEAEIAAIHREFPDLAIVSRQPSRRRGPFCVGDNLPHSWLMERVAIRRMHMTVGNQLGRLRNLRGYRAEIDVQYAPAHVEILRPMHCIVSVKNVGDQTWHPGGWHPVHLSYHWRTDAQVIEGIRVPLPGAIQPGEQAIAECDLLAPSGQGEYVLEFDLVREHVGWFKQNGSPTAEVRRTVTDYDYETDYRRADLERDYWSIVGPATKEQHEHLGRVKRQTLIDLGMTPDSRVLDVGCGTGQVTEALLDYLHDAAVYYGTDIAEEAVAFCRKKFHRANFFFCRNTMTGVPLEGHTFDVIFLSSVFTHMYPAEIKAMLLDLKRLLDPGGFIMADVFVTPDPRMFTGSRARVEINERHLMDVFDETGLMRELKGSIVQQNGGRRLGFVFRHRPRASAVTTAVG